VCVERRDFEERRVGELDGSGGEDGKGGSFGESAVGWLLACDDTGLV